MEVGSWLAMNVAMPLEHQFRMENDAVCAEKKSMGWQYVVGSGEPMCISLLFPRTRA